MKAADELAVTATAISHRMRVLESELGCRLFERKVRAVELTLEGNLLHAAVRDGFDAIAAGIERLQQCQKSSVTISTTPAFATKWLIPRLSDFQARYAEIDLRVHASDQPVNLNSGTVDLAIRYGNGCYAGQSSKLLLRDYFAPVASPALSINKQTNVRDWPLIHFSWHRPIPIDLTWGAWFQAAGVTHIGIESGVHYSEESHAIQAAIAGQGVALLSLVLVHNELKLQLLEAYSGTVLDGLSYHVVRPTSGFHSRAAAIVESWLLEVAQHVTHFASP